MLLLHCKATKSSAGCKSRRIESMSSSGSDTARREPIVVGEGVASASDVL